MCYIKVFSVKLMESKVNETYFNFENKTIQGIVLVKMNEFRFVLYELLEFRKFKKNNLI